MYNVENFIGFSFVFGQDDEGHTIIECHRGCVYAAEDARGEHLVAVLRRGTPTQIRRLFKLGLPTIWKTDTEYAVRFDTDKKFLKVLKILKPKKQAKAFKAP
jgi:hypothetical protein